MKVLVTGAAGFIGYHAATALLARGAAVVGVDNLNDYYEVSLKEARLKRLSGRQFEFHKIDLSDREAMMALVGMHRDTTHILHLGAQAGVRYSLVNPYAYVASNVMGQVVVLEAARALPHLQSIVYASSSSVYGNSRKLPFAVGDPVDKPVSLYAATKRADELMAETYAHLYGLRLIGLRYFTVYGPWGRPDMSPMLFTRAILNREPIRVFNQGEMWRDFSYIDDVVAGTIAALERPADAAHQIYNLGNDRSEKLTDFIKTLERALGLEAEMKFEPLPPGDIVRTHADIALSRQALGYEPSTTIAEGIPKFVRWYRDYYGV